MKKISYILLIAVLAVAGIYFGKDFFRGVKDGFNSTQQQESSEKTEEIVTVKVLAEDAVSSDVERVTANETVVQSDYSPAMWKIEHKGKTSYLFGSIHVGDSSMYPLPEYVMDGFNKSEVLAVEFDMDQKTAIELNRYMNQLAVDMENPLSSVLTPKTKKRYDAYCESEKLSCASFEYFEPWYLFINFTSIAALKSGLNPNFGIDKFFLDKARNNKQIVNLESYKSQVEMLDGFSKPLQDSLLYGVMTPMNFKEEMLQLASAWKAGNLDKFLDESLETMQSGEQALSDQLMTEYLSKFMYERNQVMADGIAEQINQGKSVFAVVGAAHYAGKNSVNQYLEEKGFKVERL